MKKKKERTPAEEARPRIFEGFCIFWVMKKKAQTGRWVKKSKRREKGGCGLSGGALRTEKKM